MSGSWDRSTSPLHTLRTPHALRRVAWRPEHETELLVLPLNQPFGTSTPTPGSLDLFTSDDDGHFEIWDVRRHYVAKYAIPSAAGNAVDAAWADDGTFVACFQAGGFAQCNLAEKAVPLEQVARQVMAWSPRGDLAYAVDQFRQGEIPFDDLRPGYFNHLDKVGQSNKSISSAPYEPLQAAGTLRDIGTDEMAFEYMAYQYKVEGDAPENLCDWNRQVAQYCGHEADAGLWAFLQNLIEEFSPSSDGQIFNEAIFTNSLRGGPSPLTPDASPRRKLNNLSLKDTLGTLPLSPASPITITLERIEEADQSQEAVEEMLSSSPSSSSDSSSAVSRSHSTNRFINFLPPELSQYSSTSVLTSSQIRDSTRPGSLLAQMNNHPKDISPPSDDDTPSPKPQPMSMSRILNDYPDPYGILPAAPSRGASSQATPTLRSETQNLRSAQMRGVSRPSLVTSSHKGGSQERRKEVRMVPMAKENEKEEDHVWDKYREKRCATLVEWWLSHVDHGDIQLATTIFIVGSCAVDFPRQQCERLVHAYVDLLERYKLFLPASYIRQYAGFDTLHVTPFDEGMTHILFCQRCQRPTGSLEDIDVKGKKFWWCKRCKLAAQHCAVCHESVKGLRLGCNKCHHGGHQSCMRRYYLKAESQPQPKAPPVSFPQLGTQRFTPDDQPSGSRVTLSVSVTTTATTTTRSSEGKSGSGEITMTLCPAGCGCKCRIVVRPLEPG
ncbi:hypothetical protein TREMEDRAFT_42787 [Tremella mesenterica DSM 1558]|uniref:uncharacterized protein n=1 Tax=Tremella mesenterica (strain ATCC 24925 / CBS 8224 / DSM 1558 / NBRC 9311 / NRRL Y-6157 / RJB 2259-6 / UBC 559-6) TaxID=578456 RepID=UPI0003F48D25|nr:uncharacterized protein TREMEDRAFT_42787 [Tremella mesenterica DSM 1558]EIW71387.1 hypothetical protein TREMEDRAFT_42787 [Tremella mesenterica DSM 1558]